VETRKRNNLDFLISHRFGAINGGIDELFGLDQASIRIGLDYGISDRLNIGVGRSSFEKTFDGYIKYRLLQQSNDNSIPVSLTAFTSAAIKTQDTPRYSELDFSEKLTYTTQLLIARKFNSSLSIQIMPTYLHFNTIEWNQQQNDLFALGAGGRMKITKRVSVNLEYYYRFQELESNTYDAIAIGFDIETGGHVFQLHFTNSQSMVEKGFIAETRNDFFDGDIHFGFNISRTFQLGTKKKGW
jgi:opacity protein-like surface antigen